MKTFRVNIEIKVAQCWIEDGFDLSEREQQIIDAFKEMLPYAYDDEMVIKITKLTSKQNKIDSNNL